MPPPTPGFGLCAQVYDRDEDTWTDVPTNVNSVCGGWARLANGQVGLFAGHYATLDVYQVCRAGGGFSKCIHLNE
jgi:hypothetical protein